MFAPMYSPLLVKVMVRIPCADSALILNQLEPPIKPERSELLEPCGERG